MSLTVGSNHGGATDEEQTGDSTSCQSEAVWSIWVPPGTYWEGSQHFSRGLWAIQEARWEGPLGSVGGHR